MKRILAAALLALLSSPALAGEGFICEGEGVNIHMPMAGGVAFSPLGIIFDVNGEVYSGDAAQGTPVGIAAAMAEGNRVMVDIADENYENIVAKIRLFWAEEESDPVYGGLLILTGKGAWPITCGIG